MGMKSGSLPMISMRLAGWVLDEKWLDMKFLISMRL
jgi:hypothetical protein